MNETRLAEEFREPHNDLELETWDHVNGRTTRCDGRTVEELFKV